MLCYTANNMNHHSVPRRNKGFTIIETLLFLAISMLFVLIIAIGQGSIMRRARFRDSIETLESDLVKIQEELRSTINNNALSPTAGQNVNEIVMGKVIVFGYGDSQANVYECVASRVNGPLVPGSFSCDFMTPVKTLTIGWGVTPVSLNDVKSADPVAGGVDTILFFRHHLSGEVYTVAYNRTAAGVSPTVAVQNMLTPYYGRNTAGYRELGLRALPGDYRAVIRINYADGVSLGADTTALNQIDKQYIQ
jgi:hypothetical protein